MTGNPDCRFDTFAMTHLVGHDHRDKKELRHLDELIFCQGLKGAEKDHEWVDIWMKMQNSTDKDERAMMIRSLGCADDREILRSYLQSSIATNSDSNYTRLERRQIFEAVAESTVGVQALVEFLENHERDGIQQL